MKKFINNPTDFVKDMLEGILAANANQLAYVNEDPQCVVKAGPRREGRDFGDEAGRLDCLALIGRPGGLGPK